MKKLNTLLHDVTVFNFMLLGKLCKRYSKISTVAFFAFCAFTLFSYFSQVTIHTKKVNFKVVAADENTNTKNVLESLNSIANTLINQSELTSIVYSYEFTNSLASHLVALSQFKEMDFNSPTDRASRSHLDYFGHCRSVECKTNVLRGILPGLYKIETDMGTGKFVLTVMSRSDDVTLEIISHFQKVLVESRLAAKVKDVEGQIQQAQDLILKSRSDIESKGGFVRVASNESIESEIIQQNDKIRGILNLLNSQVDQNQFQKIRLAQSGAEANKHIDSSNMMRAENFSKISKQVELLRQNIASINSTPAEKRSPMDNKILEQLTKELKSSDAELRKMGSLSRTIAVDDTFINTQITNQTTFEFDYRVTSQKVKKLQTEYESSKKYLNSLYAKRAQLNTEFLTLKPDLEYLKQMEEKLVSLKMMKSAVKSDVFFDNFSSDVTLFKRNPLWQIIAFSLILTLFFLFSLLIIVYLRDDRIYEEMELTSCFNDLEVIGKTPDFD